MDLTFSINLVLCRYNKSIIPEQRKKAFKSFYYNGLNGKDAFGGREIKSKIILVKMTSLRQRWGKIVHLYNPQHGEGASFSVRTWKPPDTIKSSAYFLLE